MKRAGGSRLLGGEREREWIRGKWDREEVEWAAEGEEGGEGQNR